MMSRGLEIFSPSAYLHNSNWLFQESKGTKWTPEENKLFENALALYDKDAPDRWLRVAAMIPGKTVGDVIKQYKELEEDVSDIEAGLIPIPGYGSNSFTLEWANNQGFDAFYSCNGKRGTSTRPSDQERKKGVPWTEEEHRQFLLGLKKYGKGDWRNISCNFVTSRTPTQVASHAQKFFIRQLSGGKDKRRSSIHDITTVDLPDPSKSKIRPSLDHSSTAMQPLQHQRMDGLGGELVDWRSPNEGTVTVFDPTNDNSFPSSFCGISSSGVKLLEQNFQRSNRQFGLYNTLVQSMQHQRVHG